MRRKKETVLTEVMGSVGYLLKHRGGINIKNLPWIKDVELDRLGWGKRIIYLDNKVPALIQDAFNNLGYEQKDGQKPVICAKRKTEYGWHLVWQLPPGVSFAKIRGDKDALQDSCNSFI